MVTSIYHLCLTFLRRKTLIRLKDIGNEKLVCLIQKNS
jgi:hypothetical protein